MSTTSFWNKIHQVLSKYKERKAKYFIKYLGAIKAQNIQNQLIPMEKLLKPSKIDIFSRQMSALSLRSLNRYYMSICRLLYTLKV